MNKNKAAYQQLQAYANSLNIQNDQTNDASAAQNANISLIEQNLSYQNLEPQRLCKIKQINTANQRIQDINRPNIIQQIIHISFPNLTYLNLRNCQIISIQYIQFLNLPHVATFQLYGNHIRNMKPLLKNHSMKKLRTLTLYRNPIKTPWKIQRQFMPTLSDYQLDEQQIGSIQDISCFAKNLKYPLQKLYDTYTYRIRQTKIRNKLFGYPN